MSTTLQNPVIYVAGGQGGNAAGQTNSGKLALAYQNLLSAAANVINGASPTALVLSSAAITSAASFEVGLTETASDVENNLKVLKQIAAFCTEHHIQVMVEANLTSAATWSDGAGAGHNELVDQWAQVAAEVGLPIARVEDVQEIATTSPVDTFNDFAAIEANAVRTIIEDYSSSSYRLTSSNLAVGDMEGGPPDMDMTTLTRYWDAYNSAATAAGVPTFSFTTSDTSWFGPWIDTLSVPSWQGYLKDLSAAAAAECMTLNVLVQGAETSTSAQQFVLQAEQNAANLAQLAASGAVTVGSIMVQSWGPQPVSVDLITSPTSSSNEAAEVRAIYPLYSAGSITAQGLVAINSPSQILLNTNKPQNIGPISLSWEPDDVLAGNRLAIVLIDQTGVLNSSQRGSGLVSKVADNILILNGTSADLASELSAITINEPNAGPDTIDIEVFGSQGRLDDTQISLFAAAPGQSLSGISSTSAAQGWLTSSAILNTGTVFSSNSKLLRETLSWSPGGQPTATIGGATPFVNTTSIHEPLAEYGIQNASSLALGTTFDAIADIFDPTVDSSVSPANGYANNQGVNNVTTGPLASWLPGSFNPAAQLVPLIVVSTTKIFDPNSGELERSVNVLAPDPITVVDRTGTHPDRFATAFTNGGTQVVEFNTGSNAAWMPGWGTQFSAATLTYSGDGRLVELFLQGGATNPWFTIDDVFDPNSGQLSEEFQSTTPPPEDPGSKTYATTTNPYQQGFATGPLYVTEFNTGNNPNWDYLDWGSAAKSNTEVWTDYFIMANFVGFADNFAGQYAGALSAYPYEFVNGSTLDLMYLPGEICVDLNDLSTVILDSQRMVSGLSGLRSIDAAGATGVVTITGLRGGGSTLIGGDGSSTITGFGRDTIVAGAGETTIITGAGSSSINISSANGATAVNGNDNLITAVAGATITATGTGDVLTYLGGGTLNQGASNSSTTATGDGVTVWMQATGGSVNISGNHNQVTGGNNAGVNLRGNNNVASTRAGSTVSVSGQQNIVYGSNVSVSVAQASSVSVTGDNNAIAASFGSVVTVKGSGSTVTAASSQPPVVGSSSLLVLAAAANAGLLVNGGQFGATLEITSGGTIGLNPADTNLRVVLDVPAQLNLGKLSFITAVGAASGHSSITAGGQNQTLQSIGGNDVLIGSPSFGDTFIGSVAGLKGDTIRNFGGSDVIDITDLSFVGLKPLSFNMKSGTLVVANATTSVGLVMGGSYQLSQFTTCSDGHGGVLIKTSGR